MSKTLATTFKICTQISNEFKKYEPKIIFDIPKKEVVVDLTNVIIENDNKCGMRLIFKFGSNYEQVRKYIYKSIVTYIRSKNEICPICNDEMKQMRPCKQCNAVICLNCFITSTLISNRCVCPVCNYVNYSVEIFKRDNPEFIEEFGDIDDDVIVHSVMHNYLLSHIGKIYSHMLKECPNKNCDKMYLRFLE
jgi:hypothetical protein